MTVTLATTIKRLHLAVLSRQSPVRFHFIVDGPAFNAALKQLPRAILNDKGLHLESQFEEEPDERVVRATTTLTVGGLAGRWWCGEERERRARQQPQEVIKYYNDRDEREAVAYYHSADTSWMEALVRRVTELAEQRARRNLIVTHHRTNLA